MKRNEGAADAGADPATSTIYGSEIDSTGQDSRADHWKGDEPNSRKTSKRK